ncbi:MAG: dTDP-4-dehydrorhamnose reductase [Lutibacter sp.]|uniref:dTDP-4-dehydrorhamnose reductase n=1 Tax=Lutibacter sp. TaxID=1925666 RepID=UPI0019E90E8C|nr:dTDP-4-dehydrorhamnose reductase [Lutibacter sp.]NOR28621.1 dTDP-4-dehydrorhamnose reductase [Lutibacter sp.]
MGNLLITGSKGQLGLALKSLEHNFSNYIFFFTDKSNLDISNFEEVSRFILINKITVIINCAAYTHVDKAEDEPNLATKINSEAVQNLAKIAKKKAIKIIHISTDYVFDGTSKIPYVETSKTNPQNVYGTSKLRGEQAFLKVNPNNSIIIRTSWLYSNVGKNFVKTMLKLSQEKETVSVVSDQIGSPTNAYDLAKTMLQIIPLLKSDGVQVYHYANGGECSWFQFAKEIMKLANSKCVVLPVSSKKFNSKAKRPNFSLLNTTKIKEVFSLEIPAWETSLKNCLESRNITS